MFDIKGAVSIAEAALFRLCLFPYAAETGCCERTGAFTATIRLAASSLLLSPFRAVWRCVPDGSRPGIVFTVDEYHFRVVLLQESLNLPTECLVKRHIFQFLGKHQAMQVAFAGLDGEILFERTGVVAVIAQFACGLYEERGVGLSVVK